MENQVYIQRITKQTPEFTAVSKQGTINLTEV